MILKKKPYPRFGLSKLRYIFAMSESDLIADIESPAKPRKRLFETGEMKLLVLHFISQQLKYSYDIIKDVASLVGGNYKPSTGTISVRPLTISKNVNILRLNWVPMIVSNTVLRLQVFNTLKRIRKQ